MSGYRDQLARVERFLTRLSRFDRPQEDYEDDLWAFFQNCWHLKDWIKNDPSVPQTVRDSIESEVAKWESLKACADLANRTKHLQLRAERLGAHLVPLEPSWRFTESWAIEQRFAYDVRLTDGRTDDAVMLAKKAVHNWRHLLAELGLPA